MVENQLDRLHAHKSALSIAPRRAAQRGLCLRLTPAAPSVDGRNYL